MNPKKVEKYLDDIMYDTRNFYETYDGGEYMPICNDIVIKCYPQSFGRVNVVVSSHYAYISRVVTRYNQLDDLYQEFIHRSLYNFYQKSYYDNRTK